MEDLHHYHCKDEGCETVFRNDDGVREHGRNHFLQEQVTEAAFARSDPDDPPDERNCPETCNDKNGPLHFHCKWVSYPSYFFIDLISLWIRYAIRFEPDFRISSIGLLSAARLEISE